MTPNHDELPLGRLEALSDAVFAIAMTLLVLEIIVPTGAGDHLLPAILHLWPSYLAYITSFSTIGGVWLLHSNITRALRAADSTLYRLNLLVLLLASFLPFPTRLVAEYFGERGPERVAAVFYGLVLLALALATTAFARYAFEHSGLLKDGVDAETAAAPLSSEPSLVMYGAGIGVSFLVPTVGVAVYLASAIYRALPARTLHRVLWRR